MPPEALTREGGVTYVHWARQDDQPDPFLAGAFWALGYSLSLIFGNALGSLAEIAVVEGTERLVGTQWVPVA